MTPEQLEAGYIHSKRQFATWGSILRRSLGLPGVLKRIAYNVAWTRVDPLWVAIIRAGLMPFATRIFEQVLQLGTHARKRQPLADPLANAQAARCCPVVVSSPSRQVVSP